jgi:hypothetical protein
MIAPSSIVADDKAYTVIHAAEAEKALLLATGINWMAYMHQIKADLR